MLQRLSQVAPVAGRLRLRLVSSACGWSVALVGQCVRSAALAPAGWPLLGWLAGWLLAAPPEEVPDVVPVARVLLAEFQMP